ncbi:MAG: phosphoribosylglycinamide synthetase C domain-containing protein [Acidimicrobiales bacterium]
MVDGVVHTGGRVLAVTAVEPTLAAAAAAAYGTVGRIAFSGAQYRDDIARPSAEVST